MALIRNGLPDDITAHARRLVSAAASAAEVLMETDPRVPRGQPRTSGGPRLVDSFQVDRAVRVEGTRFKVTARNTAPHARYTDEGTMPHPIYPRVKRALKFESGGLTYIVKSVGHPGQEGTHWWLDVAGGAWDRALAQANLLI